MYFLYLEIIKGQNLYFKVVFLIYFLRLFNLLLRHLRGEGGVSGHLVVVLMSLDAESTWVKHE